MIFRFFDEFHKNLIHYDSLTATDFVAAALASGDCNTVRELMRKKGVEVRVRAVLQSMDVAMRDVEGSDAQRDTFRYKFAAMRAWSGCSFMFFTLNPHDIHNPLLIVFANTDNVHMERISLDWDDEEMKAYYARVREGNALRLHEFAVEQPAAAAMCAIGHCATTRGRGGGATWTHACTVVAVELWLDSW